MCSVGLRDDDNDDHSRAAPAGSAYTDQSERERMKGKAFFEQGEEPTQIGIGVRAGAKK